MQYPSGLSGGMTPFHIAAGPDGNLWFTGYAGSIGAVSRITTSGSVTVFNVPTGFGSIAGIAAGYDGNMWFVGCDPAAVGKLQI
jgi:streptogramin lyase